MAPSRRDFLKIIVLSSAGLVCPALARLGSAKGSSFLSRPQALRASRWGMVVDALNCRPECTDCVAACNRVHNVPDFGNTKDEIWWISLQPPEKIFPADAHSYSHAALKERPLPVLCNHCDNPPCVRVCPTKATFKRADGIVVMDYHRCIGCRFCMAACPYGARSMNYRDPRPFIAKVNPDFPTRCKGVVEKCNFCEERLARGELPACVEACSEKALIFGDLDDPESAPRRLLKERLSIRRRPELGTNPQIYYLL